MDNYREPVGQQLLQIMLRNRQRIRPRTRKSGVVGINIYGCSTQIVYIVIMKISVVKAHFISYKDRPSTLVSTAGFKKYKQLSEKYMFT